MNTIQKVSTVTELEFLEYQEIREVRKLIERSNVFEELGDYEFQRRFRLTKQSVAELTLLIEEKLESKTPCNNALNPVEQVLIALRFVSRKFFSIAGFSKVIGALDGTFVRIVSPGGEDAERGDTGYACEKYLLTPFGNPRPLSEARYNKSHVLTRNTIQRKYGILKRRFPCLSIGLNCHIDRVPAIVVACCVLHNLCIRPEDPEPPADPQIEALVHQLELENEDATLSFETRPRCPAGFAKINITATIFFSN
ncbi:nuclease HARBI1 [Trichonephila clavipes]|nr:nuclease HARBI1 [Trichonephila clavipes]